MRERERERERERIFSFPFTNGQEGFLFLRRVSYFLGSVITLSAS
jgi:hypothetical protein